MQCAQVFFSPADMLALIPAEAVHDTAGPGLLLGHVIQQSRDGLRPAVFVLPISLGNDRQVQVLPEEGRL